ncbi:MAG: glycerol-3-phosphate 1-O-acyltransferase PlsY [Deinococcota bacterium]|nr:glycerol-3-phosphate 1-O-acyltransferase PlsY [Deinococcota bacterium]
MANFLVALSLILGYLIGSIPTGYLLARAKGVDIQKVGSGNIGATNVMRAMGPVWALIVLVFDPLKGALASWMALFLFGLSPWGVALTALAAVLGNNFNVFLGLKGGKGIATSVGAFMVIEPIATLVALAIAIFVIAIGRYVSLGALTGMISAPLVLFVGYWHPASLFLATVLALLALFRHRDNLVRLAKGNERRLGEKTPDA